MIVELLLTHSPDDVAPPDSMPQDESLHLKKVLGPVTLWGLGVGYVISGEYFGWNLGLREGGTFGLLAAFLVVTTMYVTFVFSYAELACAIPRAGGVFVYGVRGLGLAAGYLGGIAQLVEFVFATPAIASAIGSYATNWFPDANSIAIAVGVYLVFTGLNIWGVQQAAAFELAVTVLAVAGLVIFSAVTAPHFELANFTANGWPHGWTGALAAVPFAIWFYLAIEGVANAAEEARNPRRDVPRGFAAAIITLVVLAFCVFFFGVGVGGWERIVYPADSLIEAADGTLIPIPGAEASDGPLPLALGQVVAEDHLLFRLLVAIGLLGFVASLNGIILIAGRALFEMGRVGFLPHFIGHTVRRTKTPVAALFLNLAIGVTAILWLDTDGLITMSALGAVTLYVVSMIALLRLRRTEPDLPRPYRVPLYPLFPLVALILAAGALVTMIYFNLPQLGEPAVDSLIATYLGAHAAAFSRSISVWYFGFIAVAFAYFYLVVRRRLTPEDIAHFQRID